MNEKYLKTNSSIQQKEKGEPREQNMERIGQNMFGIEDYMDTSGTCQDGLCQPCDYKKYVTYITVGKTGLPGEFCIFCFPFWGFEFTLCKLVPQWTQCLVTVISGGAI